LYFLGVRPLSFMLQGSFHSNCWAIRPVCRLAQTKKNLPLNEFFTSKRDENARTKGFEHAGSIPMGLIDETDKGDANGKI
jgi:hypothetical protein